MKKIIFLTALLFSVCVIQAQQNTDYYYYKGDKIEVTINDSVVFVYFDLSKTSIDDIRSRYNCRRYVMPGGLQGENVFSCEVVIPTGNYTGTIGLLKEMPEVIDVEPVIGVEERVPVSNEIYVKLYKREDSVYLKELAERVGAEYKGILIESDLWYIVKVNKSSMGNSLSLANEMAESGLFADIDPGFLFEMRFCMDPCVTDAYFTSQWGLYEIDICPVWDNLGVTGDGVKIAVIDDGVALYNQELQQMNVVASYDAVNNSSPAALRGQHGTRVSGIIFADHNNHDIAGVAPDADMINISAAFSSNNHEVLSSSSIYLGLSYAINNNADIILCAWDLAQWRNNNLVSTIIENAIQNALSNGRSGKGCIVVFASGNWASSGGSTDITGVATVDDRIIVAGATDQTDHRVIYSCYGDALDVVAPGMGILTTYDAFFVSNAEGTSLSASLVAGVAALMLDKNPNLTLQQVDLLLKHNAVKLGTYTFQLLNGHLAGTWNDEVGYGQINAYNAVLGAQRLAEHELVIKDFSSDNGAEPSSSSYNVNNSPSIVVRDPSLSNQVVTTLSANHTYNVQVTVHNMGSSSVTLSPSDVSIYWSLNQSSMQWTQTWANCSSDCHCGSTTATGSQVTIQPGNSHTFTGQISIPLGSSPSCIPNQTQYTVSIVAVVDDGNPVLGINATGYALADFVRTSNNVAWKSNYTLYYGSVGPILPPIGITSITPNPTTGSTVIEYRTGDRNGEVVLLVTDVHGASIARETGTADACRMEMGNVHAGFYYVYLIVGGETLDVKPLIVN